MEEEKKFVRVERGVVTNEEGVYWSRLCIGPAVILLTPNEAAKLSKALLDVTNGSASVDVEIL